VLLLQKQDYGRDAAPEIYCTVKPLHTIGTACPSVEVYRLRYMAKALVAMLGSRSSPRLRRRCNGAGSEIERQLCDMVTYSIITPTFNRRGVIVRSIESSLAFIRIVRNAELVVIDDASCDGTVELLCGRYADEIACGVMTLRVRSTNGGVTAARAMTGSQRHVGLG
jgi:Glycosyl transferase family 2